MMNVIDSDNDKLFRLYGNFGFGEMTGFDGLESEMECCHFACAGIDPRRKLVLRELSLGRARVSGRCPVIMVHRVMEVIGVGRGGKESAGGGAGS